MLRRRQTTLPYLRLKDWADSGEALTARCESCAAEQPLRPAALVARHGWHGGFAKAMGAVACVACGGATEVIRTTKDAGSFASSVTIRSRYHSIFGKNGSRTGWSDSGR